MQIARASEPDVQHLKTCSPSLLESAYESGHASIVKYALDDNNLSPAELRLKSCLKRKDSQNVLYVSCARGYTFTVSRLLSHVKSITRNTTDFDNYTRQAFFYAIHQRRVDTIDALYKVWGSIDDVCTHASMRGCVSLSRPVCCCSNETTAGVHSSHHHNLHYP